MELQDLLQVDTLLEVEVVVLGELVVEQQELVVLVAEEMDLDIQVQDLQELQTLEVVEEEVDLVLEVLAVPV